MLPMHWTPLQSWWLAGISMPDKQVGGAVVYFILGILLGQSAVKA